MASPASAVSEWVQKEVKWWLDYRDPAKILIALTEGEIRWTGRDFDWTVTDAVPALLAGVFAEEPHWIDLRKLRPSEGLEGADSAKRPRLGDIVAEFAAPIRGQEKDSLVGDHIRYQRRIRRLIWAVTSSLAILLVVAVTAGIIAARQADKATTTLATSDFRQGSQLLDNEETANDGIAFLARAAEAGDTRAQTRLWTILQQRSFWLPASADLETPVAGEPTVPAVVPQQVLDRFSSVDVNGSWQAPQSVAISGDGKRVFTAVGDFHKDVPALVKVWNVDGTAVTDWWEPPYSGDQWLNRIRGYLNETGNYLAVELEGWRETAELVVYDVENRRQFETDITASGLLPQTQSIGFNSVQFVEHPAKDGESEQTFLVTASAKGDAVVYELHDEWLELARDSHRSSVGVASIDADGDWLMTAGMDGTVSITSLDNSTKVGNLIHVDPTVTALRRIDASRLLVETNGGKWAAYDLQSPVRRKAVEVSPLETEGADQELCLNSFDLDGESETRLEHPSGLVISAETNPRQVSIARAGESPKLSPIFAADIDVVCGSVDGSLVTVTTADFRTEIWRSDFSERQGLTLDERPYFTGGWTPESTHSVALSPDGQRALIRSSFWNPPNVEVFWISLWDIQSGLPLMDRTEFVDDGLTAGVVRSAGFAADGHMTFIGDGALALQSLELSPPAPIRQMLPQFAEAIVDRRINAQGLAEHIPDRMDKLASGIEVLKSMNLVEPTG